MRKYVIKQCILLIIVLFLVNSFTACSFSLDDQQPQEEEFVEPPQSLTEQQIPKEVKDESEDISEIDTKIFGNRYYYSNLTKEEQEIYAYLYEKIDSLAEEIIFSQEVDSMVFHKSYYALIQDCPEFFWLNDNLQISILEKSGNITEIYITFDKVSSEEIRQQRDAINEVSNRWLSEISSEMNEYEQIKAVFELLVAQTEYVEGAQYNQDIRSVFLNRESVCTGYAKAMEFLLSKRDIFCTLVSGEMIDGSPHCWNLVRIDDTYYWVDVTQGDAASDGKMTYFAYLCFDDEILNRNYIIDKHIGLSTMVDQKTEFFSYPACVSNKYNYFKMQETSYDSFDLQVLQEQMRRDIDEGKRAFAFQFTTQEVYDKAVQSLNDESLFGDVIQTLINEQGVSAWEYSYSSDPRVYAIYILF